MKKIINYFFDEEETEAKEFYAKYSKIALFAVAMWILTSFVG